MIMISAIMKQNQFSKTKNAPHEQNNRLPTPPNYPPAHDITYL